jgi:hypothetical protein
MEVEYFYFTADHFGFVIFEVYPEPLCLHYSFDKLPETKKAEFKSSLSSLVKSLFQRKKKIV